MAKTNMTTLCYIENQDSYLMLHRIKKEKDVNKDKWIGVGGHFEPGESPEECLLREVKEETGFTLTSYRFRGLITFIADQWQPEYMCLYTADGYEGEQQPCEEGQLEWVRKKQVLDLNLWEGDKLFFQLLNEDAPFFSLKLRYQNDRLMEAVLDGENLELLEECDRQGCPTGRVQARRVVHENGMVHPTAHVWLVRPNDQSGYDLLLQKRSADKDAFPGCYDISSAGHVPAGSDYLKSAIRELEEELGITAQEEDLQDLGLYECCEKARFYGKPFFNHEISRVYLYKKEVKDQDFKLQKEEVDSVAWMDYQILIRKMEDGSFKHCLNKKEIEGIGQALGLVP